MNSPAELKVPTPPPARRAESAVMASGAAVVGLGILGELAAPAWSFLPAWLHPVLAANEGLIIVGITLLGAAAIVRRARGRDARRHGA